MEDNMVDESAGQLGVLLYYKFVTVPDPLTVQNWFSSLCSSLHLLGRIRIAPEGINVTVGGGMKALHEHIIAVDGHPLLQGCDFKLSSCCKSIDPRVAEECGFSSLSVRVVKELVSLNLHPSIEPPSIAYAGRHVTAQQLHSILEGASSSALPITAPPYHVEATVSGALRPASLTSHSHERTGWKSTCNLASPGGKSAADFEGSHSRQMLADKVASLSPALKQEGRDDNSGNPGTAFDCALLGKVLSKDAESILISPTNPPPSSRAPDEMESEVVGQSVEGGTGTGDEQKGHGGTRECVMVDARNIYETRIGKFKPPPGVPLLVPMLRQYSDLPAWLDDNADQLRDKCVLIAVFCVSCAQSVRGHRKAVRQEPQSTVHSGGVRCEMASAYLRKKGKGFEDVFQLSGGIHRYLEAFPDGGYFAGKNFVFDHRMAVGSSNLQVLGCCLVCKAPFDDYSARNRCSHCRLLVLVCTDCQASAPRPITFVCELCDMTGKGSDLQKLEVAEGPLSSIPEGHPQRPKLKILCLHGFRQNASSLKGRLSAFRKKLKHTVDLYFIDAPHELPFVYHRHGETVSMSEAKSLNRSLEDCNSPTIGRGSSIQRMLPHGVTRKYAWLISPSMEVGIPEALEGGLLETFPGRCHGKDDGTTWIVAKDMFDPLQYQSQTAGWSRSFKYLQQVFSDLGPFDGVLGFSQGASIAAALVPLRKCGCSIDFKFVVLCSGFPSPIQTQSPSTSGFDCPSLHIYGEHDRQIGSHESEQLADMFQVNSRMIVQHSSGHMIPTKPEYLQQYLNFFTRFVS